MEIYETFKQIGEVAASIERMKDFRIQYSNDCRLATYEPDLLVCLDKNIAFAEIWLLALLRRNVADLEHCYPFEDTLEK